LSRVSRGAVPSTGERTATVEEADASAAGAPSDDGTSDLEHDLSVFTGQRRPASRERRPRPLADDVAALADEVVRRLVDIQTWLTTDARAAVPPDGHEEILDGLDELAERLNRAVAHRSDHAGRVDGASAFCTTHQTGRAEDDGAATDWVVGRDRSLVAHAVAPQRRSSACGLIGFAHVEDDDWRDARGRRCPRCEAQAT
jgi:hypothetical protein